MNGVQRVAGELMLKAGNDMMELLAQLDAARYAMERLRFTVYAQMVVDGRLPREELPNKMRAAMENYDSILRSAAEGHSIDAIRAHLAQERDYLAEFDALR